MARVPEYMKRVAGWEQFLGAFIANAENFVKFEPERERLEQITGRFKGLINQRAAHAASKQDASREIRDLFREGETLADHLRTAVRTFFGLNSEKLVEFGLQPSRARRRRKAPPGPEAPAPVVASPLPEPQE